MSEQKDDDAEGEGLKPVSSVHAEIGLTRLAHAGLPTEAERDAALELSFRALRAEQTNPHRLLPHPDDMRVAKTQRVGGEVKDAPPVRQPPGIDLIDKIADALSPPAKAPRYGDRMKDG
jgi:hypothetical protein